MKTVEEEAKKLIDDFGDLALKVVNRIMPECYDGSLSFWKKVYYEVAKMQSNKNYECSNNEHDYKLTKTYPIELSEMKCSICEHRRYLTPEERIKFGIGSVEEYIEKLKK